MSDSTESINNIIRSIGYIALCFSIFLFLTIKILKYLLARKEFNLNLANSQNNTPISTTPMIKTLRGAMVERSFTP